MDEESLRVAEEQRRALNRPIPSAPGITWDDIESDSPMEHDFQTESGLISTANSQLEDEEPEVFTLEYMTERFAVRR